MNIPLFLYLQSGRGLTPSQSALILVPMAVCSGVLSPFTGRFLQDRDARAWTAAGLVGLAIATAWYGFWFDGARSPWWLLLPSALVGISASLIWGPLADGCDAWPAATARGRAGSGVYNTTRQVGAVIGSAVIAAVTSARLTAHLGEGGRTAVGAGGGAMPTQVLDGFAAAMGESMYVPATLLVLAVVSVLFMRPQIPSSR